MKYRKWTEAEWQTWTLLARHRDHLGRLVDGLDWKNGPVKELKATVNAWLVAGRYQYPLLSVLQKRDGA